MAWCYYVTNIAKNVKERTGYYGNDPITALICDQMLVMNALYRQSATDCLDILYRPESQAVFHGPGSADGPASVIMCNYIAFSLILHIQACSSEQTLTARNI